MSFHVVQEATIPVLIDHAVLEVVEVGHAGPASVTHDYINPSKFAYGVLHKSLYGGAIAHVCLQGFESWRCCRSRGIRDALKLVQ